MHPIQTERLEIRPFTEDDADFIVALLNDPGWLRYIGDRQVRTADDARRYLRDGPMAMVARRGFGLSRVSRRADGVVVGMCGLIERPGLDDVDIGFAFLPVARGHGHAREAAAAVLAEGLGPLGLKRIVAITDVDNLPSQRVLDAIGLRFERLVRLSPDDAELKLYATPSPA